MKRWGLWVALLALSSCTLLVEQGISDADKNRDGGPGGPGSDGGGPGSDGGGPGSDGGPGNTDGGTIPTCTPPDGGFGPVSNWTLQAPSGPQFYAVWGVSDQEAWAAGVGSVQHYVSDAWGDVTPSDAGTVTFYGVRGSSPSDVWAVGVDTNSNAGVVWRWNGSTWSSATPNWSALGLGSATLYDVWPQGGNLWVAGYTSAGGLLLEYTGGQWIQDTSPAVSTGAAYLYALASDSSGALWATGVNAAGNAVVLKKSPGGSWTTPVNQPVKDFESIWMASPTVGWAGGDSASDFYSTNGGSWTASADTNLSSSYFHWHALWGTGVNDAWAVSSFGLTSGLVGHWNGTSWSALDLSTTPCGQVSNSGWDAVSGSCHTLWLVNGYGQICQGTR